MLAQSSAPTIKVGLGSGFYCAQTLGGSLCASRHFQGSGPLYLIYAFRGLVNTQAY
jgi:hypothetical protein